MNTVARQARDLVAGMLPDLDAVAGVQTIVCPPFVHLSAIADILRGSTVRLGAQNMHDQANGAYTGEISPSMVGELCEFVIVGHSERRLVFAENDEFINRKVRAALETGLTPILCIGEQLQEREQGRAEEVVTGQLTGCLSEVRSLRDMMIAYEPVWAIGTGRAATPDVAQRMMAHIRGVLASLYTADAAAEVPLLYGGSVNADNIAEYMREPHVNGALVGGASLIPDSFLEIVRRTAEAKA